MLFKVETIFFISPLQSLVEVSFRPSDDIELLQYIDEELLDIMYEDEDNITCVDI